MRLWTVTTSFIFKILLDYDKSNLWIEQVIMMFFPKGTISSKCVVCSFFICKNRRIPSSNWSRQCDPWYIQGEVPDQIHFSSTSAFIEPTTDHLKSCAPINTRKLQKPVTCLADSAYNPAHVGYLSTMYTMV